MPRKLIDLTGKRFGRWTVLRRNTEEQKRRRTPQLLWACQCDCGTVKEAVYGNALVNGASQSCGCLKSELTAPAQEPDHLQRGFQSPVYRAWRTLKSKCFNPNHAHYANNGGKGITMHPDWISDFEAFASYIGPKPSKKHILVRLDLEGHYAPGNVKWADSTEHVRIRNPITPQSPSRSDLTGRRFSRWTVLHENTAFRGGESTKNPAARYWTCKCDCGRVRQAMSWSALMNNCYDPCECQKTPKKRPDYTYRTAANYLYRFWREKRQDPTFFCPEWHDDFMAFATEIGPQLPLHARLRRAYPDKPCAPENIVWCVWTSPKSPPLPTTAPQKPRRRSMAAYQEDPQRLYAKAKENNVPYAPLRRAANDPTDYRTLEQVIAALRTDGLTFDHGYAKKA